jgi:uncharacterized protein (TIGR03067 family)
MKQTLILALALCLPLTTRAAETEEGFKTIFNGKDLNGWDGNPKLWWVKDGAIVGQTTTNQPIKVNTFLIWTNGVTTDFELRCSFRITAQNEKGFANSGIQYRSKVLDSTNWVVGGYQADMEAGPNYTGILYDEAGGAGKRGIMAARGEKVIWDKDGKKQVAGSLGKSEEIQAAIKKDSWNEYVVIAQGNHLQHFINSKPTVDVTDECDSKALTSGVLALQVHVGGPMTAEFKNLRIKTLPPPAKPASDDAALLNGVWSVVSSEADGVPMPAEDLAAITVTIAGGKYSVTKGEHTDQGAFTIDAAKSPKQMDIRPSTGEGVGMMIPAIYEFNGDTWRVCYATQEGSERPTGFKTAPESGQVMTTYQRKPAK